MKMVNKTNLNTKQLKAFVRQIALNEQFTPAEIKALQVRAIYRKRSCRWADNHVTGYAYYNSPNICLKFVKGIMPEKVEMAKMIAHELAHTQGVHHRGMRNSFYGWEKGWREHWAWAEKLPLTMNASVEDKKPERNQVILQKVTHCLKMIVLWERKAKLAKTKQKKWEHKLSYYQKQGKMAAAQAPSPEVKQPVGAVTDNTATGKPIEVPEGTKEQT